MANVYETPILYGAAGGTYMDEAAAAYYAQQMAGQYPTDMVRPHLRTPAPKPPLTCVTALRSSTRRAIPRPARRSSRQATLLASMRTP